MIGRQSVIRAGARILPRVSIGEHSVIGQNSVIGSEGYGFVHDEAGNKTRIPHLGGVIIGSHVEIGAFSIVENGTIASTVIEDHAKIDESVEIGHNARVGRGASVTGGVVIGGSAVIAADALIGINASVRDGRQVGAGALVGMDASVQQDLPEQGIARAPRPAIASRSAEDDGSGIGFAGRSKTKWSRNAWNTQPRVSASSPPSSAYSISRGTAVRRCRRLSMPDCARLQAARSRIEGDGSSWKIPSRGSIVSSVPR